MGGNEWFEKCQEAVISWELSAVMGPHQEFHPGGQQNYVACGRQTLFMTDTVSTSPSLLTAPDFV